MATTRPDLTGLHILIVDDCEDARAPLGRYLRHLGASVTLARNAGEALAVVHEIRAHVIISDLAMPGIDGIELVTRIRALDTERRSPTPAIAFSGFADRINEALARRAGFDVFIPKPADPLDIALHVQRLAREV
jgi:CheY-like chemotaxis protein